jgi:hypothetical protein
MSGVADTTRPVRSIWTSLCFALAACTHTTNFNTDDRFNTDDGGEDDGGIADGAIEEDAGPSLGLSDAGGALCGNDKHVCACSNGEDDDLDGKPDGLDNECTGAFDDDEGSFRVNNVREGKKCSDCFFDGNPASGDDGCSVPTHCRIDGTPGNGGGMCKKGCAATAECRERCVRITPNGCDCFGCCEVLSEGTPVPTLLVGTCNMDKIHEVEFCPPCQINTSCYNPCDACDLCPGKGLEDLPLAPCMNAVQCPNGRSCEFASQCGASEYCSQGCCATILL